MPGAQKEIRPLLVSLHRLSLAFIDYIDFHVHEGNRRRLPADYLLICDNRKLL